MAWSMWAAQDNTKTSHMAQFVLHSTHVPTNIHIQHCALTRYDCAYYDLTAAPLQLAAKLT